jgi:hypothetical protein
VLAVENTSTLLPLCYEKDDKTGRVSKIQKNISDFFRPNGNKKPLSWWLNSCAKKQL